MITALANGCQGIIATAEIDAAQQLAEKFPSGTVLLGGERDGFRIPGFDLSNSPAEYTKDRVYGKKIIFTSSNGSQLFRFAAAAENTVVAAFSNISVVADFIVKRQRDVAILCAGKESRFALEDAVCGGMLVDKIAGKLRLKLQGNDSAFAARILYQSYAADILNMLYQSSHGKYLIDIGQESDLALCAAIDAIPVLPVLKGGELILLDNDF